MEWKSVLEVAKSVAFPLVALSVIAMLLAQLKLLRQLRAVNDLLLYYGKQIEEMRRMMGNAPPVDVESSDESSARGMCEIVRDAQAAVSGKSDSAKHGRR